MYLPTHSAPSYPVLAETEFMAVLKRLAWQATAAQPVDRLCIDLPVLQRALRYVTPVNEEVRRVLQRALKSWPSDEPATDADVIALMALPEPNVEIDVSSELRSALKAAGRRSAVGLVRLRGEGTSGVVSARSAWYFSLHRAVLSCLPGQQQVACDLARSLALQLTDPRRVGASFAFLSGSPGSGTRQAARAVADALTRSGYRMLEMELSAIRSEGEARVIDGGDPGWAGMRPGEVTRAAFEQPKTVFLLHDIDQTFPSVHRALLPALRDGHMEDQYGLGEPTEDQRRERGGRFRTQVDMRQAVFLVTSSVGHDLWSQPDLADLLAKPDGDLRDVTQTIVEAMRSGEHEHRGETYPLFDPATLAMLERQLVLFRPLSWNRLLDLSTRAIEDACRSIGIGLGLQVDLHPHSKADLALAYLASQGGLTDLNLLTGPQVEAALFRPLVDAMTSGGLSASAGQNAIRCEVRISELEAQALQRLLAPLGHEPGRQLLRRRLALRFDIDVKPLDERGNWCLECVKPRLAQIRSLADFRGDAALTAAIPNVRYADVAGHDEAKAYLQDIASQYARADHLHARGIELPRGAVLHGPPGTGKTKLAQAMAAEAGMAFIATAGADLLNPDRVKQVFEVARRNAPALVFIDEIDTLGRRGDGSALHDAAINRLLAAIQGFDQRAPVFVLAATNRPKRLDTALTRPGRLDRAILVGALDRAGRMPLVRSILALLPRPQREDETLLNHLLSLTHGLTGAALCQIRRDVELASLDKDPTEPNGSGISAAQVIEAINAQKYGHRVGASRRDQERLAAAIHEAGHAICQVACRPGEDIEQVSITPRGQAEGFLALDGDSVRNGPALTADELRHRLAVLLAGRVAEQLHFGPGHVEAGASSDLARGRTLAFVAVAHYGMDNAFGSLSLAGMDDEDRALLPESQRELLWTRVRVWLGQAEELARDHLKHHWGAVRALADELLLAEFVPGARVAELVRSRAPGRSGCPDHDPPQTPPPRPVDSITPVTPGELA